MITGGNWGNGSYAGGFSTKLAIGISSSDAVGVNTALIPTDYKEPGVRPIDANALVYELVEIMGGDYDDDTIRECIKIVKNSPTIKKRFGKWKKV